MADDGALGGAVAMIGLVCASADSRQLTKDLFAWYCSTNLPIYQIAQQVGYAGALQFNKAFKNRMQVPPRTWRLQNRLRLSGDPDRK